jgi:monoamine oxidase
MKKRPAKPIEDKKHRAPGEQEPFSAIRLAPKLTAAIDKWAKRMASLRAQKQFAGFSSLDWRHHSHYAGEILKPHPRHST